MIKYLIDRGIILTVLAVLAYGAMWAGKAYITGKTAEHELQQKKIEIEQRTYKELKDQIARLESSVVTKSRLKKIITEELSQEVKKLIVKNKETPTHAVSTIVHTKQEVNLDPSIWKHYANPDNPSAEYYFMKLYKTDDTGVSVPWAWIMYFPNREKKWKYGFYPLDIKSTTMLTRQKHGGANVYTKLTIENTKDKESKGKIQKFHIDKEASYVKWIQPKDKEFLFWNPAIDFGLGIYYNIDDSEFINGVEVGFTFMGYGNEYNMDYKFMTMGLGSDFDNYWVFLRPISVNLTKLHLPLIHHLYFAPVVGYSFDSNWLVGCSLNLEF